MSRELSAGYSEGKLPRERVTQVWSIMEKAWLGVDAAKEAHWAHMLDASGTQLLSRRVKNEEADLSKSIVDDALLLAKEVI